MKSRIEELENDLAGARSDARSAREAADRKASDVVDLARRNLMLESRVAELASRMDVTNVLPLRFDGATTTVGHEHSYGANADKEGRYADSSGVGGGGGGGKSGGGGSGGVGSGAVYSRESEARVRDRGEQGGTARGGEETARDERGERSEFLARLTPPLGSSVTHRDLLGGSEPHYAASSMSYLHSSRLLRTSGSSGLSPTRVASMETATPTSTGAGTNARSDSTNGVVHDT